MYAKKGKLMHNPFGVSKWNAVLLTIMWAAIATLLVGPLQIGCGGGFYITAAIYALIAFAKFQRDKRLAQPRNVYRITDFDDDPPAAAPRSFGIYDPTDF